MKYSQIIKNEIILASQSKVRKEILEKNNIKCKVIGSNIDEDPIKESLVNERLARLLHEPHREITFSMLH